MQRWVMIFLVGALPACTDFPEVDAALQAEGTTGDFPTLLPMDTLLARADGVTVTTEISTNVADRLAALRRKADRLRGPVLSRNERRRLEAAAARHTQ